MMAIVAFLCFTAFEKKGIVKYRTAAKGADRPKKDYKGLLQRNIIQFSGISMLTGIIRTAFVGFLSTYFYDYLKYSESQSASIFSVATLIISFTTFIAIFIYERMGRNIHLSTLIFFCVAAVFFCITCIITNPIANIAAIIIAIMASNAATTMLWSVYCPSLCDTGLVSGITGFLDFLSYAAAALASLLIPHLVELIHWRSIILVMAGLMTVGAVICVPHSVGKRCKTQ